MAKNKQKEVYLETSVRASITRLFYVVLSDSK